MTFPHAHAQCKDLFIRAVLEHQLGTELVDTVYRESQPLNTPPGADLDVQSAAKFEEEVAEVDEDASPREVDVLPDPALAPALPVQNTMQSSAKWTTRGHYSQY